VATAYEYPHDQQSTSVLHYREALAVWSAGHVIDVFASTEKRTNIVIANVSGHDMEAHGHARYLRHAIRTLATLHSPGSLLGWLNVAFQRRLADFAADGLASVFLAEFQDRRLKYASSGHCLALLMHASGRHARLPLAGSLLGVKPAARFREKSLAIAPGDWLVLVTDAIANAQNAQGVPFGASGVARNMFSAIRSGVDNPAAAVLEGAIAHGADRSLNDTAVLCVRFPSNGRDTDGG
jgi:serine phosphatase RsbU (regulator of sigma subunit)